MLGFLAFASDAANAAKVIAMTVPFRASKTRVRAFLDALQEGTPLDNGGSWSMLDMLTLAGVLHAAVLTHPPAWAGGEAVAELDDEKREAVEATHEQEVVDAIRFLSLLSMDVLDGNLDTPRPGDVVEGVLMQRDGDTSVVQFKHAGGDA